MELCHCGRPELRGEPAPGLGGSACRCGSEQLCSHGLRDATAQGRTVGPGEASREMVWVGNGCKMPKHLPRPDPRSTEGLGCGGTGKGDGSPQFRRLPQSLRPFQNLPTLLTEKHVLSEFITKIFVCPVMSSLWGGGRDVHLWDGSQGACSCSSSAPRDLDQGPILLCY